MPVPQLMSLIVDGFNGFNVFCTNIGLKPVLGWMIVATVIVIASAIIVAKKKK